MVIKDDYALKLIKKVRSQNLNDIIKSYPDEKRNGRSDMQFLADEVSYVVSKTQKEGHAFKEELNEARKKLYETDYGKNIPINQVTMEPQSGYWLGDIQSARDLSNEFRRMVRLQRKLQSLGYRGRWNKA